MYKRQALLILLVLALDRKHPKRKRTLILSAASAGLVLVFGFLAGSVVSLDNPTAWPVRVQVNGTTVDVPPQSFTDVRVSGPSVGITTETGDGSPLEVVELGLELLDQFPLLRPPQRTRRLQGPRLASQFVVIFM